MRKPDIHRLAKGADFVVISVWNIEAEQISSGIWRSVKRVRLTLQPYLTG